jgi:hypothetical protein
MWAGLFNNVMVVGMAPSILVLLLVRDKIAACLAACGRCLLETL